LINYYRVYIFASLFLSGLFGIPGLIYANCINMSIRIITSLYLSFRLEKTPHLAFQTFLKDLRTIDLSFALDMGKRLVKRKKD
jgi:hypothetical protein